MRIVRPKTSDASQAHQPPQEPSWYAHHDPKIIVSKHTINTFTKPLNLGKGKVLNLMKLSVVELDIK